MRVLFPYPDDLAVLRGFLQGSRGQGVPAKSDHLERKGDRLIYVTKGEMLSIDTGGSLVARVLDGAAFYPSVRLIHAALRELGQPEREITREETPEWLAWDPTGTPGGGGVHAPPRWQHFIDGTAFDLGTTIVLCGPLGLQAYRAGARAAA